MEAKNATNPQGERAKEVAREVTRERSPERAPEGAPPGKIVRVVRRTRGSEDPRPPCNHSLETSARELGSQ